MNKQKKFIISFLVIIYGVLGFYGLKQLLISTGKISLVMTDNWVFFEPKKEKNIIDKVDNKFNSLKTTLENKSNNYFPFYLELNKAYEKVNFESNKLLYNNVPIRTNVDGEYLFYNDLNDFYYLETKYNSEELESRYNKQVNFFNDLSKRGINVNIYIPTRYELTTLKDNNLNDYVKRFDKDLDEKINLSVMNINSITEYKNRFYATDHHWNIKGALDGYYDIMTMLRKNPISNLKPRKVNNIKYYGSMAKTAMNTKISDELLDVSTGLKYNVTINGKKPDDKFKPRFIEEKNNIFYDYYVGYFNGQYNEVVYDYNVGDNHNLLILCDSYAWQIDYIIAASYDKTYVVNIRYSNEPFYIEKYMKDNNISDVLFLYEGGATLFDVYDYDFVGKVK